MSDNTPEYTDKTEARSGGTLEERGVRITAKSNIDALSSRGYGTSDNEALILNFYEALYLVDKEMLEVRNKKENEVDFINILRSYEKIDQNAWANFLIYRDLRSRGYVVREGFGIGISFRMYKRGSYGKETAAYLILGTQEGKPLAASDLAEALQRCRSQKKELVLGVMNRRGEIVYYSVSELQI